MSTVIRLKQVQLLIRKANAEDAEAVWCIRNDAIRSQCVGHYDADVLAIWTERSLTEGFVRVVSNSFYVATFDGTVVGMGLLNCGTGRIDAIFVRPDMMRQGIGSKILAFLEGIAVQHGLTRLTLDSTLNAAPFYRKCGFMGDEVGTHQSPRGISLDCIPMSKDLPSRQI